MNNWVSITMIYIISVNDDVIWTWSDSVFPFPENCGSFNFLPKTSVSRNLQISIWRKKRPPKSWNDQKTIAKFFATVGLWIQQYTSFPFHMQLLFFYCFTFRYWNFLSWNFLELLIKIFILNKKTPFNNKHWYLLFWNINHSVFFACVVDILLKKK